MKKDRNRFDCLLATLSLESSSPVTAEISVEMLGLAERLQSAGDSTELDAATWLRYLEVTGSSPFLRALPTREHRYCWAETSFKAILTSGYTLETMLGARVLRHPDRTLLRAARGDKNATWSYAEVAHRLRILAGLFCRLESEPRVAIFSENSIDSACCDLACLVHRIFDTPLNIHFDAAILAWIFNRLGINIVITDTEERALRLAEVRSQIGRSFYILKTGTDESETIRSIRGAELLDEVCARTNLDGLDELLAVRRGFDWRP